MNIFNTQVAVTMKVLAVILLLELLTRIDAQGCSSFPSTPANARSSCRLNTCTYTCIPEYQFPDGSSVTTVTCNNGVWIPTNRQWTVVPDCRKSCAPPCVNEGTCLSYDICQCPQKFRGPQCQYSVDVCTGAKLKFNGDYKCRGNTESFVCTVSCPEGINFDKPPQNSYTCQYDTGLFDATPPTCVYGENMETSVAHPNSGYNLEIHNVTKMNNGQEVVITVPEYITIDNQAVTVITIVPGVCFAWGDGNIKTFDGKIYSASSSCEEVLANDLEGKWSVSTIKSPNGDYRSINIKIGNQNYKITKTDDGNVIVLNRNNQYNIPVDLDLIKVDVINESVVIQFKYIGVTIKWDRETLVQVEISPKIFRSTGGLCGFPDGNPDNDLEFKENGDDAKDLTDFIESWSLTKPCNSINETHACTGLAAQQAKANDFCNKLLSVSKFAACYKLLELSELTKACTWDYCKCQEQCACTTLNVVDRNCIFYGVTNDAVWRDPATCPIHCTNGKVFMNCQPERGEPTCTSPGKPNTSGVCTQGCYCPPDTYLYNEACVPKAQCPCIKQGFEYFPGSVIQEDCNNCTCRNGDWSCTQKDCRGVCSCIGDPHYTTIDGKYYNFMGLCNYYLVKIGLVSVEGENAKWLNTAATITESVIVKVYGQQIKIKQARVVEINGVVTNTLPAYIPGATVRRFSSTIVSVLIYNGIEVHFDGVYSAVIYIPTKLKGQTRGLCGTYNNNQNDDFLTPLNAVVTDPNVFGNSWITGDRCKNVTTTPTEDTCAKQADKDFATKHCSVLKSSLFSPCHDVVPVEPEYQNCLYDMCTCAPQTTCLCPMLSSYAKQCSNQGINIDWVNEVPQCSEKCDSPQIFSSCTDPCKRTCADINNGGTCPKKCIEGCTCPDGQTLDANNNCISISRCSCRYNGLEYSPGYKETRKVQNILQLCTCQSGIWNCIPATPGEIITYPENKGKCDVDNNFEFTNCAPVEPTTCLNMLDDDPRIGTGKCEEGCKCSNGYVLNNSGNKCIKPLDCICEDELIQSKTISTDSIREIYSILYAVN